MPVGLVRVYARQGDAKPSSLASHKPLRVTVASTISRPLRRLGRCRLSRSLRITKAPAAEKALIYLVR